MVARPDRGREPPLFSLVFPAYNPGRNAERAWDEARAFVSRARDAWEVIFVCDGCSDRTAERLSALAGAGPEWARVVEHWPNRGKGYAVRRGLQAARGRYRIFTDIDLAYGFEDISRLAEVLRAGADVAIASRVHPDSRLLLPPALQGYAYRRHLQSMIFSAVVRLMLPVGQHDTQAGLKGMSARAADLVLPRMTSRGFEFDCELLTACARFGLGVVEVPVCVRYSDAASTTGMNDMSRMVRALWRIRREWAAHTRLPIGTWGDANAPHGRRAA